MPDPASAIAPIAPETQPESPAPEKIDAERFAQLARREKAIRTEAKRLADMKTKLAEDEKKYQGYMSPEQAKARFLQDPTSLGLTPEELSTLTLAQLNQDPQSQLITKMQQQIEELRQGQQKTLDAVSAREQKAYDEAIKNISREVSVLVDSDNAFEMIKATSSQEAVVQLIRETYDQSGVILSNSEACQKVEDYLLAEAEKLTAIPKVKSKLAPPPPVNEPVVQPAPSQQRTLTHAGTPPAAPSGSSKDRRARAIAAFLGSQK